MDAEARQAPSFWLRRQQQLAADLISLELAERERLADVIHDAVLQDLGVCILKTELCGRLAELGKLPETQTQIEELGAGLDRVVEQLRAVMQTLRPPVSRSRDVMTGQRDTADLLGTLCQSFLAQRRPVVRLMTPVPDLSHSVLQVLVVRLLRDAIRTASASPAVAEVALSFHYASDLLRTAVECRRAPTSGEAAAIELDPTAIAALHVLAAAGGGSSVVERETGCLRLVFHFPLA